MRRFLWLTLPVAWVGCAQLAGLNDFESASDDDSTSGGFGGDDSGGDTGGRQGSGGSATGGEKATGGDASSGGSKATGGETSSGGITNSGGDTASGGTNACDPETEACACSESDPDSCTAANICLDDHCTKFAWNGHAQAGLWDGYIHVAEEGALDISPTTLDDSGSSVCLQGTLAAGYENLAMLTWNVNQPEPGATPGLVKTEGTGLFVDLANPGAGTIRAVLVTNSATTYCAEIKPGENSLPWSSFTTECWMTGGAAFPTRTEISAIHLIAVAESENTMTPVDFCALDWRSY